MSAGKGDRPRNLGPLFAKNYGEIKWHRVDEPVTVCIFCRSPNAHKRTAPGQFALPEATITICDDCGMEEVS